MVTNLASAALQAVGGLIAMIVGLVICWNLMVKRFNANLLGARLMVVISWVVRFVLFATRIVFQSGRE